MFEGKTLLAVVPARGGSKRVLRKNLRTILGKSLIAWTILEAKKSKYIDRLVMSSEDKEIIAEGKKWGCESPFIRPIELAQDDTPGVAPIIHLIRHIPDKFDYVVLLQPTSPLRGVGDIDGCIESCLRAKAPSCVSLVELEKKPQWMYEIGTQGKIIPLFPQATKQDFSAYVLNGAVYVAQSDWLINNESFIGPETIGVPMERENSLDIDTESDLNFCEILMAKRI